MRRLKDRKTTKPKRKITITKAQSKTREHKLRIPRTPEQFTAMSEVDQENWNRVSHVISKMRANRISLTQAAREFNLQPKTVIALGKSALRKQKNGRYAAKKSDRLLRILVIPSPNGLTEVSVRSSEAASKIAQYSDTVQKYLRTGDTRRLAKFKNLRLKDAKGKTISLLVDSAELNRLGSAGVLSFESLYARVA